MYRVHCSDLTVLGQECQLQLYKTKIAITEIKAGKLFEEPFLGIIASYISEVFDHLLQCGKHMFLVGMRMATENLVK